MALPREQENIQNPTIPPTEGSLAVDPRAVVPAAPAAEPIPFPGGKKAEPTEPPTQVPAQVPGVGRRKFLATLGGIAGGVIVESNPVLRAVVNPYFEKLFEAVGLKEAPVPPYFDNRADKGLIGDNNILPLSSSQVQQKFPEQVVAEGDTITFLFPFQAPEGGKIGYERSSGLPALADPNVVPESDREKQAQAVKEQEEIKRRGIRSQLDFVLPKDTVIVAPVGGHIMIPKGRQDQFGGRSDMTQWGRLTYHNPDQNITYVLWFMAPGGAGVTGNLYPLLPMQDYTPDAERGINWQKLPEIQQGQPMLQTTRDIQLVRLGIKAYRGKIIGPQAEIVDKTMFYVTPDFITTTDNTNKEKLVVLQD